MTSSCCFDGWNLAMCAARCLEATRIPVQRFPLESRSHRWQIRNLPLPNPELYNLEQDPDESYNVAADQPQVVAQIQARIKALLPTFPVDVINAWNTTMSQQVYGEPDGALPVRVTPQP